MAFGLLNVCKPSGPTSHDLVAWVRRGTGERRVGHAGTLDPLAEGVLVLALGPATRLVEYLAASRKQYIADLTLGLTTDTHDIQGQVIARCDLPPGLTGAQVETILERFRGEIDQVPPVYSAIKVRGRAAYARARSGESVTLPPRRVVIDELSLLLCEPPLIRLSVRCSAGTYVRSLARDLGEVLGCGAALAHLTRTTSGIFTLEDAVIWDTLQAAFAEGLWQNYLLPADQALDGTPRVALDETALEQVRHGGLIPASGVGIGLARAYSPQGQFVAVLSGDPARGAWHPEKVFLDALDRAKPVTTRKGA